MINILQTVAALFVFCILVTPIVLTIILLFRVPKKNRETRVSPEHIAALEQNDNIIVEDINAALTEIVSRLEAIEDRLDREESTVKGFASKKGKQQLND
jgi:predicted lipid-binding transport protein (Tim44 family)